MARTAMDSSAGIAASGRRPGQSADTDVITPLLPKLQHSLVKIRARALASLVFKLREQLADVRTLDRVATNTLVTGVVACCAEPELEVSALHALELLLDSNAVLVRACLQSNGAVVSLQRAAMHRSAEIQAAYEKLIEKIYVTTPAAASDDRSQSTTQRPTATTTYEPTASALGTSTLYHTEPPSSHSNALVVATSTTKHAMHRRVHERALLPTSASSGWRFATVALAAVDEQFLFEFEVALRVRTSAEELVRSCERFRHDLLRNFPVEVFLQRPAIVQHLLYLVQQPLLPGIDHHHCDSADNDPDSANDPDTANGPTDTGTNDAMASALQYALGVNYFDDLGSRSFAPKSRNRTAAVLLAALRAIESFVLALQRATAVSLDPKLLAHDSVLDIDISAFDSQRRAVYPRVMTPTPTTVERRDTLSVGSAAAAASAYSLGGAVLAVFTSLLPLLASPHHPRVHVLNVLLHALPLLRERGADAGALDTQRITHVLALISDYSMPDATTPIDYAQLVREYSSTVTAQLLELVVRLLHLHPPAAYSVQQLSTAIADVSPGPASSSNSNIVVPIVVWRFVQTCVVSTNVQQLAVCERWGLDDIDIVAQLSAIDPSLSSFIDTTRRERNAQQDVDAFLAASRRLAAAAAVVDTSDSSSCDNVTEAADHQCLRLEVAHDVALRLADLNDRDVDSAVDGLLAALSIAAAAVSSHTEPIAERNAAQMRAIVLLVLDVGAASSDSVRQHASARFGLELGALTVVAADACVVDKASATSKQQCLTSVLGDAAFVHALLLRAAATDDAAASGVWPVLAAAINALSATPDAVLADLAAAVPLLQHFAFVDASATLEHQLQALQPQLVTLLTRVERVVAPADRLVLIARCLLHTSAYVRRAAASGVLDALSTAAPAAFERIADAAARTGDDSVLRDPFAAVASSKKSTSSGDMSALHPLAKLMLETPLPPLSDNDDDNSSTVAVTPSLAKLSTLRKLLAATGSNVQRIRETTVRELQLLVDSVPATDFAIFEELGEVVAMKNLLLQHVNSSATATTGRDDDNNGDGDSTSSSSAFTELVLVFLRNLLRRSVSLRRALRKDARELLILVPLVFDTRVRVRAQMCYIVLLLTLTAESFATGSSTAADIAIDAVPQPAATSFGLHANVWTRCGIRTCRLATRFAALDRSEPTDANSDAAAVRADTSATRVDGASVVPSPPRDVAFVLQRLQRARSHGAFLNALYQLVQLAYASATARTHVATCWERVFARIVTVAPQSERDEVVVAAVLNCIDAVLDVMDREQQLRVLLVVKRSFVPLFKRAAAPTFAAQLLRVLLHLSVARVADLFPSLAVDTNVLDVLGRKYATQYAAHPLLHALALDVARCFAMPPVNVGADAPTSEVYRDVVHARLLTLVVPLLSVLCRHRVPGSFMDRDVFEQAAQTLAAVVAATPRAQLLDSALGSDSALLADSSWSSRLLFDHTSSLRALGYEQLAAALPFVAADTEPRLLQLAIETSVDATECDAVRGAACSVVHAALLQFAASDARVRARLLTALGLDGRRESFAVSIVRALVDVGQDGKLLVSCGLHLCRLLRLLLVQRVVFADAFGDVLDALTTLDATSDVYAALVQMLSLRAWEDACTRYCDRFLRLGAPAAAQIWRSAVEPMALAFANELLVLLIALLQLANTDAVDTLIQHTPLQVQVVELVDDVAASLARHAPTNSGTTIANSSSALLQRHYDTLEASAVCLCCIVAHRANADATSSPPSTRALAAAIDVDAVAAAASMWSRRSLLDRLVFALEPTHPTRFRASFARILLAVAMHPGGTSALLTHSNAAAATALCSSVFELFHDCATQLRDDSAVTTLRRVASALIVLLEASTSLRQLVVVKRGLQRSSSAITETFHALRLADPRALRTTARDEQLRMHCTRITMHFDVLAALVGGDADVQALALRERVLDVVLVNWATMRLVARRGSHVLLHALRFVNNLVWANDRAKAALVVSSSAITTTSVPAIGDARERSSTLFTHIAQLAVPRDTSSSSTGPLISTDKDDMAALQSAACAILKAAVVHPECLQFAIKSGVVLRLLSDIQRRLRALAMTSKRDAYDVSTLCDLLGVLASVAATDEGRVVIYSSARGALDDVVADILSASTDPLVLECGSLFVRNLALSRLSKSYFAVWETAFETLLERLLALGRSQSQSAAATRYFASALWSIVFDNQKARTLLLAQPSALQQLEQLREATARTEEGDDEVRESLVRVLVLVKQ